MDLNARTDYGSKNWKDHYLRKVEGASDAMLFDTLESIEELREIYNDPENDRYDTAHAAQLLARWHVIGDELAHRGVLDREGN